MNSRLRMRVYRTTHLLHWISAAVCFTALALFTITGITLNHAGSIAGKPAVTTHAAQVPEALRGLLAQAPDSEGAVAAPLAGWIKTEFGLAPADAQIEWSEDELYLSATGPGRDAWVSVDRASGAAKSENTDHGWLAYFNDLHKGRNTGIAWRIFIDVVAAAVLFFSLTGLVLLQIQARQRRSTWPLVIGGSVLMLVLMIFFIH
jgi:uncharacterized protein